MSFPSTKMMIHKNVIITEISIINSFSDKHAPYQNMTKNISFEKKSWITPALANSI